MRLIKITAFYAVVISLLAGCAASKGVTTPPGGYVEVPNPAMTLDPNATPTIWVPRSYVDSGVPRGGEILRQGYEQVKGALRPSSQPQQPAAMAYQQAPPAASGQNQSTAPAAGAQQPASAVAASTQGMAAATQVALKSRIAVLETGDNGLRLSFTDTLRGASVGIILDPAQAVFLTRYATITTEAERAAFAVRLQQEYGATVAVFVSAPETIAAGNTLQAEIYDGMAGALVRTVSATIPSFTASDAAAKSGAVAKTQTVLAERVKEIVFLLPWYGKVVAVDGERIYLNAGREAGLKAGQLLKVYRPGKMVAGIGFAPGERVALVEIAGFVGVNGAYGVIREGKGIQAADLVAVE